MHSHIQAYLWLTDCLVTVDWWLRICIGAGDETADMLVKAILMLVIVELIPKH